MDPSVGAAAVTTLERIRDLVRTWIAQQGHQACWYYPDVFNVLAAELGVVVPVERWLPAREEFQAGCRRYQEEVYRPHEASLRREQIAALPVFREP